MPLGPRVDFTRSAIAIAPTNDACSVSSKLEHAAERTDAQHTRWAEGWGLGCIHQSHHCGVLHRYRGESLLQLQQQLLQQLQQARTMRAVSPLSSVAPAPSTPDCCTCNA